jgi:hypothetical protein
VKKVKYNGEITVIIPSLGLEVSKGNIIGVPDNFNNALFEDVPPESQKKKEVKPNA